MSISESYTLSRGTLEDDYIMNIGTFEPCSEVFIIPCVFHVIHEDEESNIPEADIHAAIATLNARLALGSMGNDTHIRVELAKLDPDGHCTNGINRIYSPYYNVDRNATWVNDEGVWFDENGVNMSDKAMKDMSRWPPDRYLNIWTLEMLQYGISAGYVYMPGVFEEYPVIGNSGIIYYWQLDGIVIDEDLIVGSTEDCDVIDGVYRDPDKVFIHEFGHYLGLCHTWFCPGYEGLAEEWAQECHSMDDCLIKGDRVCDTPQQIDGWSPPCTSSGAECENVTNSCSLDLPDLYDMHVNYMGYGFSCADRFSSGQTDRMQWTLCNFRPLLSSCYNLEAVGLALEGSCPGASTPDGLDLSFSILSNISCPAECSAQAVISVEGGNEPYTLSWDGNSQNDLTVDGLCTGANIITIQDAIGCEDQLVVQVSDADIYLNSDLILNTGDVVPFDILSVVSFDGNLILNSGWWTFNTNTFLFTEGHGVIIRDAANGLFTKCILKPCGKNWHGIEVLTNSADDDGIAALGLYDCTVIGAEIAIYVNDENPTVVTPTPVFGLGTNSSSLIGCWLTTFLNNETSVFIENSIRTNILGGADELNLYKAFMGCTFKHNQDYYNHFDNWEVGRPFVRYAYAKHYGFAGCKFINDKSRDHLDFGWWSRDNAIQSFNARYDVIPYLHVGETEVQYCEFRGFNKGIEAYVTEGDYNHMRVIGSEFRQNKTAMQFYNVCYHDVIGNTIIVGEDVAVGADNTPLDYLNEVPEDLDYVNYEGIVQIRGALFTIAENQITASPNLTIYEPSFGIRIRDTDASENEVYHNYLTGLTYANKADGDNMNLSGTVPIGLRYVCNVNTNNVHDFHVAEFDNSPFPEVGIAENQQGAAYDPDISEVPAACNEFTNTNFIALASNGHFFNGGDYEIMYHYFSTCEAPELDYTQGEFANIIDNTSSNPCSPVEYISGGDGDGGILVGAGDLQNLLTLTNQNKQDMLAAMYLIAQLLDGGSTIELEEELEWSNDTWYMRQKMLGYSPHLTSEMLHNIADDVVLFPHAVAFEIFMANRDMMRDNRFITHLETKAQPMPAYMIDLLVAARDQNTLRTTLGLQYATARKNYDRLMAQIQRICVRQYGQTAQQWKDKLNDDHTLESEYELALLLAAEGNKATAQQRLNTIASRVVVNKKDANDVLQFQRFFDVATNTLDWTTLSTAQKTELEDLANTHWYTHAGVRAMAVLNFYNGGEYSIAPAFSDQHFTKRAKVDASKDELERIKCYPNPANQLLNLSFSCPFDITETMMLQITDATGRLVTTVAIKNANEFVTLDTTEWESGLYFYQVQWKDGETTSGKFDVVH